MVLLAGIMKAAFSLQPASADTLAQLSWQAASGRSAAMFELGDHLSRQAATASQMRLAKGWLLSAARRGHLQAAARLGHLFLHDPRAEPDVVRAEKWLTPAALGGARGAASDLVMLYGQSLHPEARRKARFWLSVSVQRGEAGGCLISAWHLAKLGKPALSHLICAAEDGNRQAMQLLAQTYAQRAAHSAHASEQACYWTRRAGRPGPCRNQ